MKKALKNLKAQKKAMIEAEKDYQSLNWQLQQLIASLYSTGNGNYSGMPKMQGNGQKIENMIIRKIDLEKEVKRAQKRYLKEKHRYEKMRDEVEKLFDSCGDSQVRSMLIYRYVDGLTWRAVSFKIGGGITEDGCRKAVSRYLNSLDVMK